MYRVTSFLSFNDLMFVHFSYEEVMQEFIEGRNFLREVAQLMLDYCVEMPKIRRSQQCKVDAYALNKYFKTQII